MKNVNVIPEDFDWEYYLYTNKDVAECPMFNSKDGAIKHWLRYGKNEGRRYKKDNLLNFEPLKCLNLLHNKENPFIHVEKMLLYNFKNVKEYNNYLIILGYNSKCDIKKIRKDNPNKKIVIYQLEQLYNNGSNWYNKNSEHKYILERTENIRKALSECDEIWDYDLDNIDFLLNEGFTNIKHIPMYYTEDIKSKNTNLNPKYDILFYGSLNERRIEFLRELTKNFKNILIIAPKSDFISCKNEPFYKYMIESVFHNKIIDYILNSKIILNLHYYDSCIQEQVRLFEVLINNKLVVSEKSRRNYYNDLILEFENKNEMIDIIKNVLDKNLWMNLNVSEKFKKSSIKKDFKIGAVYNTFYGLEQLEKSILSIRNITDYIVVVHQHKDFYGNDEPNINKYILEYLKNNKLIDEIIYYNIPKKDINQNFIEKCILEKRNLGLTKCKENNCDYLIPLDTDELYNSEELYDEIKYMHNNKIDTLYSPILSYYYDDKHYFEDTYYVPSVYKIDDRNFKLTKTSILIDPVRKMEERKYKISNVYMHHHTYFIEQILYKIKSYVSINSNINKLQKQILNDLISWDKKEKNVNVIINDLEKNGELVLKKIILKEIK